MADMGFLIDKAAMPGVAIKERLHIMAIAWNESVKPRKTSVRLDNKQIYK
jgi:hypothetical protein